MLNGDSCLTDREWVQKTFMSRQRWWTNLLMPNTINWGQFTQTNPTLLFLISIHSTTLSPPFDELAALDLHAMCDRPQLRFSQNTNVTIEHLGQQGCIAGQRGWLELGHSEQGYMDLWLAGRWHTVVCAEDVGFRVPHFIGSTSIPRVSNDNKMIVLIHLVRLRLWEQKYWSQWGDIVLQWVQPWCFH